jgi:hypothetical protein
VHFSGKSQGQPGQLGDHAYHSTAVARAGRPSRAKRIAPGRFIEAARLGGNGEMRILLAQVLPSTMPLLAVQMSLTIGYAILNAAGLSFIGLGISPHGGRRSLAGNPYDRARTRYPQLDQAMSLTEREKKWGGRASRFIKAELKRAGIGYKELADRLNKYGLQETETSITGKPARGTFAASFFPACLTVL